MTLRMTLPLLGSWVSTLQRWAQEIRNLARQAILKSDTTINFSPVEVWIEGSMTRTSHPVRSSSFIRFSRVGSLCFVTYALFLDPLPLASTVTYIYLRLPLPVDSSTPLAPSSVSYLGTGWVDEGISGESFVAARASNVQPSIITITKIPVSATFFTIGNALQIYGVMQYNVVPSY